MSKKVQTSYETVAERRTSQDDDKKKKRIIPLVLCGILGASGIAAGTAIYFTHKPQPAVTFNVTFDPNYASAVVEGATEIKLEKETTFGQINKPKLSNGPDGKTFECWTSDQEGLHPILDSTKINKQTKVYAKWSVGEFNLKFTSTTPNVSFKGTTEIAVGRGKTWGEINKPNALRTSDPTYDYELDYWTTNESSPESAKLTDATPIDKNLTIYPIFKNNSKQVQITFQKKDNEVGEVLFNGFEKLTISVATDLNFSKWNKPSVSKIYTTAGGVKLVYPFDKWQIRTGDDTYEDFDSSKCFTSNTTIIASFTNEPSIYESKYYVIDEEKGLGEIVNNSESYGSSIEIEYQGIVTHTFISKETFNQPVYIGAQTTSIVPNFLAGCKKFNQPVYIPKHVTFISSGFLSGCDEYNNGNEQLEIPDTVLGIGSSFLQNCPAFNQQISFGNGLETIGDAFLYNSDAFSQDVDLSNCTNLKTIGSFFLSQCGTFNNSITFPTSLTEIGDDFLSYTDNFSQDIDLSETKLTKINNNFLYNSTRFVSQVTLKESNITEIGDSFLAWTNPDNIITEKHLGKIDFSKFTNLTKIGDSCLNKTAFSWDEIVIPASVTKIGSNFNRQNYWFTGEVKFASGSQLNEIGNAFLYGNRDWNNQDKPLALPSSLRTIGTHFLSYCHTYNNMLTIPSTITKVGKCFVNVMSGLVGSSNYIDIQCAVSAFEDHDYYGFCIDRTKAETGKYSVKCADYATLVKDKFDQAAADGTIQQKK